MRLLEAAHGDTNVVRDAPRLHLAPDLDDGLNVLPISRSTAAARRAARSRLRMQPNARRCRVERRTRRQRRDRLVGIASWRRLDPFGFRKFGVFAAWMGSRASWRACTCASRRSTATSNGGHDPFAQTLLASQAAVREMDAADARRRDERRATQEKRRQLQETADRLLDRINELGGVDKLSAAERKELERASRRWPRTADSSARVGSARASARAADGGTMARVDSRDRRDHGRWRWRVGRRRAGRRSRARGIRRHIDARTRAPSRTSAARVRDEPRPGARRLRTSSSVRGYHAFVRSTGAVFSFDGAALSMSIDGAGAASRRPTDSSCPDA